MEYIQSEFFDIGLTGGYFESLVDGAPIQQSKSLFSHALLLQLLLKLANFGISSARIYLISLWRTISQYFRETYFFLTTLNRGGKSASSAINTIDNVMMLYSMSSLPLIATLNYTKNIEFKDQVEINMGLQVPNNIGSTVIISVNGKEIDRFDVLGSKNRISKTITLDPIRPSNNNEEFKYEIQLLTQGVFTDSIQIEVDVSLNPGVDLSLGVITVFSIITIVIFVLFVKRYENIQSPTG